MAEEGEETWAAADGVCGVTEGTFAAGADALTASGHAGSFGSLGSMQLASVEPGKGARCSFHECIYHLSSVMHKWNDCECFAYILVLQVRNFCT